MRDLVSKLYVTCTVVTAMLANTRAQNIAIASLPQSSTILTLRRKVVCCCTMIALFAGLWQGQVEAGFVSGTAQTSYGDSLSNRGEFGTPPVNLNRDVTFNGMHYQTTFTNGFNIDSLSTDIFQTQSLVLSGNGLGGAGGLKDYISTGLTVSQSIVDFSGLAQPGYNESFYTSLEGKLSYHVAPGDTFYYRVVADVTASPTGLPLFTTTFEGTTNTPGDYEVSLNVPKTYITDLITLNLRGEKSLQSDYAFFTYVIRAENGKEATTFDFDPGVGIDAVSNTIVPEPSSLLMLSIGLSSMLVIVRPSRSAGAVKMSREASLST